MYPEILVHVLRTYLRIKEHFMYQYESIPKYNSGVLNSISKYLQSQTLSNICKYSNKAMLFSKSMHIWQKFFVIINIIKFHPQDIKKNNKILLLDIIPKDLKFPHFGNYWLMHNPTFATFYTGYISISSSKYEQFIFQ